MSEDEEPRGVTWIEGQQAMHASLRKWRGQLAESHPDPDPDYDLDAAADQYERQFGL